eukprot:CAMPEP_0202889566 /NCGR_PEP_ID=MMETSP1392-20130828/153_1 /ASSEMBLY_ACC=CAM_ASM_000868 /TAXON_ID=225041 /ORGANISM="Chlamydomonas chlamydogama, Strain SAG 11-48b" /LENGTH=268 /DNA_ID=CAMNT_0049572925 /DNA_START=259 /DNA_END=1064 /DNA_ORIENTATION=+
MNGALVVCIPHMSSNVVGVIHRLDSLLIVHLHLLSSLQIPLRCHTVHVHMTIEGATAWCKAPRGRECTAGRGSGTPFQKGLSAPAPAAGAGSGTAVGGCMAAAGEGLTAAALGKNLLIHVGPAAAAELAQAGLRPAAAGPAAGLVVALVADPAQHGIEHVLLPVEVLVLQPSSNEHAFGSAYQIKTLMKNQAGARRGSEKQAEPAQGHGCAAAEGLVSSCPLCYLDSGAICAQKVGRVVAHAEVVEPTESPSAGRKACPAKGRSARSW